ncbi:MAG: hypothetical protein BGO68_04310 [Candidatus Amoebophilus sp. 36-38]|nr:MAG: hypothetical protein BGO68_04310 [Candidatus Amoebophilus sp. 36-38]
MKQKQFDVLPIAIEKLREKPRIRVSTESSPAQKTSIKILIEISSELSEKLKDQSYALRMPQPQVAVLALEEFCNNNPVEPRPESEKNKKKTGRKRKS